MGKSETVTTSIGLKIKLSDLLEQTTIDNFILTIDMLECGFIQDDNEEFNHTYENIIDESYGLDDYLECRDYILDKLSKENLLDEWLLVPIKDILENTRHGYNRYGTNGISRELDFDLSVDLDKYKDITGYSVVFMIKQHSY